MRIATYRMGGHRSVGRLTPDGKGIQPFELAPEEARRGALALLDRLLPGENLPSTGPAVALDRVELEAPIPQPRRNIFCVGKNYHAHAHEFAKSGFDSSAAAGDVPEAPIIFSKVPECVTGPGTPILVDPRASEAIDYEAELAVIVGKGWRGIPRSEALDHVLSYTIVNDVTARDLQRCHKQWLIGKSQDSFCPMGPWLARADEIDLADTAVRCWVNGELRQNANTGALIFDVPCLIETLSRGVSLIPGDIIATGTPAGVGIGFDPPKYLKPGDTVRIEIAGIGVLENPVARFREAA
jgi:2-keto-4-pentenoate hydratase/2-oxohepta-3-ene-1,7-dioic acid hydratase in catechol pathway